MSDWHVIWQGTLGSLAAGSATGIGSLGVFLTRNISLRFQDSMLSAAAGVMLAATFFSLLLPGLHHGEALTGHTWMAALIVSAGILMGAGAIQVIHNRLPHEHAILGREGPDSAHFRRIWLFIIAITLHNFPEGMAVGVGFGGDGLSNGIALAAGIGLQNIPEGLAVSLSMLTLNYSRSRAFLVGFLTGLVEPVGGLFGSAMVWLAEPIMPWTLGFAAGAMLFIISDEIIPETHRGDNRTLATFSLLVGFVIMMFLDASLG